MVDQQSLFIHQRAKPLSEDPHGEAEATHNDEQCQEAVDKDYDDSDIDEDLFSYDEDSSEDDSDDVGIYGQDM